MYIKIKYHIQHIIPTSFLLSTSLPLDLDVDLIKVYSFIRLAPFRNFRTSPFMDFGIWMLQYIWFMMVKLTHMGRWLWSTASRGAFFVPFCWMQGVSCFDDFLRVIVNHVSFCVLLGVAKNGTLIGLFYLHHHRLFVYVMLKGPLWDRWYWN